jgi:hypothetical protein
MYCMYVACMYVAEVCATTDSLSCCSPERTPTIRTNQRAVCGGTAGSSCILVAISCFGQSDYLLRPSTFWDYLLIFWGCGALESKYCRNNQDTSEEALKLVDKPCSNDGEEANQRHQVTWPPHPFWRTASALPPAVHHPGKWLVGPSVPPSGCTS